MTLFKFETTEHFGPMCGCGGYGSTTAIGFGSSPKQAIAKSVIVKTVNDGGGGVPILKERRLYKNGKLLKVWY